jgi:cytochrome b6-f complex iron-sulfur subunit
LNPDGGAPVPTVAAIMAGDPSTQHGGFVHTEDRTSPTDVSGVSRTSPTDPSGEGPSRRGLVTMGAAAALGVAGAAALAGCGSGSSGTGVVAAVPSTAGASTAMASDSAMATPAAGGTAAGMGTTDAGMASTNAGMATPTAHHSTAHHTAAAKSIGSMAGSLAKLSSVPVGGAISATLNGRPIVIAQPRAGKIVAFTAICTHAGCTVAPTGATLNCPCHGSTFDALTGENTGGPAPSPLSAVAVRLSGSEIVAG